MDVESPRGGCHGHVHSNVLLMLQARGVLVLCWMQCLPSTMVSPSLVVLVHYQYVMLIIIVVIMLMSSSSMTKGKQAPEIDVEEEKRRRGCHHHHEEKTEYKPFQAIRVARQS